MGRQCCIKNCSNSKDKNPDLSIHKFPSKDISKYNKWMQAIPPDFITLPIQHDAYICCMHFSENAFQPTTPTGRTVLKKDAVPSIFYTESADVKNDNNIIENFTYAAEQMTLKRRASVDASTQVSPRKQRLLDRQELQRKVHILQQRLHRRDTTIATMRNFISTLKTNNSHT